MMRTWKWAAGLVLCLALLCCGWAMADGNQPEAAWTFRGVNDQLMTHDEISFSVTVAGAERTEILIYSGNDPEPTWSYTEEGDTCRVKDWTIDCEAELTFRAVAHFAGDIITTQTYDSTIIYYSNGALPVPIVHIDDRHASTGAGYAVGRGENVWFTFEENGDMFENGERKPAYDGVWYNAYLYRVENGRIAETIDQFIGYIRPGDPYYFETNDLPAGGEYWISVDVQENGYTGVATNAAFAMQTGQLAINVLNAQPINGVYSGSYYYKMHMTTNLDFFEMAWSDIDAEAPREEAYFYNAVKYMHKDSDGSYTFFTIPPLDGNSDAMFYRKIGDTEWMKMAFEYDRTASGGTAPQIITGQDAFETSRRIEWTAVDGADAYIFHWKALNNRFESSYTTFTNCIEMEDYGGGLWDFLCEAGTYECWVDVLKNNQYASSGHVNYTNDIAIALEENEQDVCMNADGSISVPMHQWINFRVSAPGSNNVTIYWTDNPYTAVPETQSLQGSIQPYEHFTDLWAGNDWAPFTWTPNDLPDQWGSGDYDKYVIAEAHYYQNNTDIYRRICVPVHVAVDQEISEDSADISYSVPTDVNTLDNNGVALVARNGIFYIDVDGQDADDVDFYGLYITKDGVEQSDHYWEWNADSHWTLREENRPTRVQLTVGRCEPNATYQVHVYAIRIGAPQIEATNTVTIHVTPAMKEGDNGELIEDTCPVVLSMQDTYMTGDHLRVYAHYTEAESMSQAGWMRIVIYRADDPEDVIFDRDSELYDFWETDNVCWQRGNYIADAYIMGVVNGEPQVIAFYPGVKTFRVDSQGPLAPILTNCGDSLPAGQDLTVNVFSAPDAEYPVTAERIRASLVRTDYDGEWLGDQEKDANNGAATFTFDKDEFRLESGGSYILIVEAFKPGYDMTWQEYPFIVTDIDAEPTLTLTVNDYSPANISCAVPSSTEYTIRVTYGNAARPTAIRITDGRQWNYWFGDDEFEQERMSGDAELLLYAEATWDEIDFDELIKNNWQFIENGEIHDFDWNRHVSWTARSNIVHLSVISPEGIMVAPNYSILNEQMSPGGSREIPWGDELQIFISDQGPMGTRGENTNAEIIEEGWFFGNMLVERYDEYGNRWEHFNDHYNYMIHSGINYIPTYNLEDGCRYRIEIGADAPGYSGRSRWEEFTVGTRPETQERIRSFHVKGGEATPTGIAIQTGEELQLLAYDSGAEWYSVEITKAGDSNWYDERNECRSGMLMDSWRVNEAGTYILTAYAYGHLEEPDATGNEEWREEIGSVTVTATAVHGDMGAITAAMPDRAYLRDPQPGVTFSGPVNAEHFGYWIHTPEDNRWIIGDERRGTGTLQIDTRDLEPGVYWVEVDAMGIGYNQSHDTLYFALLEMDCEMSAQDDHYYFSASATEVPTETDVQLIGFIPGAEAIRMYMAEGNDGQPNEFEYREGPGVSTWFSTEKEGNYRIYISGLTQNGWSTPEEVCTLTITATGTLNAPVISINGDDLDDLVVPADETDLHHMTITIDRDTATEWYEVELREYGEGWHIYDQIHINGDNENDDDRVLVTIGEQKIIIDLTDERIRSGRMYEINCRSHAAGLNCGRQERVFLLQEESGEQNLTLEVTPDGNDPNGSFWTAEDAWVVVKAKDNSGQLLDDVTAIKLCMNNETRYYRGNQIGTDFTIWDVNTVFHAYATTGEIPGYEEEFDWEDLDVAWSIRAEPVMIQASTDGDTEVPTLTFNGHVTKGEWLEFTIEDDGDARQMDIRIRDDEGKIYEFRQLWAPGTYRIPTGNLNAGQRYNVNLSCIQSRRVWTEGPYMDLYVDEPGQAAQAFFRTDKTTLYPNEPFIPCVFAPGAVHIWITDSNWDQNPENDEGVWGDWEGDNGTNHPFWEWTFENTGTYTLTAWAQYPNAAQVTKIDDVTLAVIEPEPLAKAQFIKPLREMDLSGETTVTIAMVPNGYYYNLQVHTTDMQNQRVLRLYKTAEDAIDDNIVFTIPANDPLDPYNPDNPDNLLVNQSYWLDCYVEPLYNHQYAYRGSDSSINVRTVYGTGTDSYDKKITVSRNGSGPIPVNQDFEVTVSLVGNPSSRPTAVAVYMGDRVEYRRFDANATSVTVYMREYQAWPEVLYAKAYYGDLSEYDEDDIPWDTLAWGNPSESMVNVIFASYGEADPPAIALPEVIVTGDDLVIHVTPGEHANEAHANLDRNIEGWEEDRVFDDWIGWDAENGTITISMAGVEPGLYQVYVDNSGEGYENSRARRTICILGNDPYQFENRLELPASLTEIGDEAFAGIAAETVIIPNGVTRIGSKAFAGSNVRYAVIPAELNSIANDAFEGCDASRMVLFGWSETTRSWAAAHGMGYHAMGTPDE